eukprot:1146375-Pelagomonas_calceolata.AAC.2
MKCNAVYCLAIEWVWSGGESFAGKASQQALQWRLALAGWLKQGGRRVRIPSSLNSLTAHSTPTTSCMHTASTSSQMSWSLCGGDMLNYFGDVSKG